MDEGEEALLHRGAYLEIVLNDGKLTVEVIIGVVVVCLHDLNEIVKKVDQARAVLFKGKVPFSVPVRVGDDM